MGMTGQNQEQIAEAVAEGADHVDTV